MFVLSAELEGKKGEISGVSVADFLEYFERLCAGHGESNPEPSTQQREGGLGGWGEVSTEDGLPVFPGKVDPQHLTPNVDDLSASRASRSPSTKKIAAAKQNR